MRNILQAAVLVCLMAFALTGCEGGNCPFQRPACCDDTLFGCGPFDLPTGCSCGDYFSRSFQGVKKTKKETLFTRADLSMDGTWRVSLNKTSGGCSYLQDTAKGNLLVRERSKRVSLKLRGITTLTGVRYSRRVRARGQYKVMFPKCTAEFSSTFALINSMNANVSGTIAVFCRNAELSCQASYIGKAVRL